MVKLPWIPSEADWLRLLAVFADEPIRIRFTEHLPRAATGKLYRNQVELP